MKPIIPYPGNAVIEILVLISACMLSSCARHPPGGPSSPPSGHPNVVFILLDDQGWAGTSVQMDPGIAGSGSIFFRTPNISAFAKMGIIFANGYAAHCNCSPSRASILTGKSPAQLGMTDVINRKAHGGAFQGNQYNPPPLVKNLPLSNIILPAWIKQFHPEYQTALIGKWHVSKKGGPETYGFDYAADTVNSSNPPFNQDPKHTFSITRDAIEWMQTQVKQDHPFYLQICYHAVHLPMECLKSTYEQVESWGIGTNNDLLMMAAMTKDLDSAVGMVLQQIKTLGIQNNTYVIYTSDNGLYPTSYTSNLAGPLHGWKSTMWQGGLRVPYIVSGPGIHPGRSDVAIEGEDIFPTICDWLGIHQLPSGIEGGSFASVLTHGGMGEVQRPNDFLAFYYPHYQFPYGAQPSAAIIEGDYKLIKFYEGHVLRLYDLSSDVAETTDISKANPDKVTQMDTALDRYLRSVHAILPVKNPDYDSASDPGKDYWDTKARLMTTPYFVIHQ